MTFKRKPAEDLHPQLSCDRGLKTIHTMDSHLGGKGHLSGVTGRIWPFDRKGTSLRASSRIGLVGGTPTRIENGPLASAGARV